MDLRLKILKLFLKFNTLVPLLTIIILYMVITPKSSHKTPVKTLKQKSFQDEKNETLQNIINEIIDLSKSQNLGSREKILDYVRDYFLHPPSKENYNLKEDEPIDLRYVLYKKEFPSWRFINSILMDLYKGREPGFFVEAGALDGEYLSNTLQLEKRFKWNGLLVEVEESNYVKLRKKNRKCWSSPLCLATKSHPHEIILSIFDKKDTLDGKGAARIQKNITGSLLDISGYQSFQKSLCVPSEFLLDALNISHVDFFSLDVEESELSILSNFPFNKITVDIWSIEHVTPQSKVKEKNFKYEDDDFISFMEQNGYYLFDIFCHSIPDYIFIRKNSPIFKDLRVPSKLWRRRGICEIKGQWDPDKMNLNLRYLRDRRHWPRVTFRETK